MTRFTTKSRDYAARPNHDNGRSHYGYGHTNLRRDPESRGGRAMVIFGLAVIAYFAWQFCR